MGYYAGVRGDYYGGYRGDPGFFSFMGKLIKGAAGFATSLMPGGGMVSKAIERVPMGGKLATVGRGVRGFMVKHPVLSAAGAAGVMSLGAGHELTKHKLKLEHMVGMGRRRRRMRVTNPKALRRAIRRCDGFSRLAVKVLRFTHPRKAHGRPVFKVRRRKKI